MVLTKQMVKAGSAAGDAGTPPPWKVGLALLRNLVLTVVAAELAASIGIDGWFDGAKLGLGLWLGFPAILLSGSVIWENVSWRLAVIHSGDWLLKLLIIAVLIGVWR
ncbi:DUF1761 domain-containing protein [Nocardia sp. NPDC051030]|uniref:DUF1761 domain-containing protein n=1 Tax=Nocardia sp. NPDC051030 TaxID=3155162 RepID=UPI0034305DDB